MSQLRDGIFVSLKHSQEYRKVWQSKFSHVLLRLKLSSEKARLQTLPSFQLTTDIVGSASSQNPEYSAFCRFKAEKHLQNKLCASVGKMKAEGASLVSWQKPILAVLFFKLVAFSYSFGFHFCWFFFAWKAWILEQFLVVQKNASQPGRKQLPSYFWLLYLRH